MEQIMISRLQAIVTSIDSFTQQALNAEALSDHNVQEAEILYKKFESFNMRFTTELNSYFRLSKEPSADDISNFSVIQLKAEEVFSELACKIKTLKDQSNIGNTTVPSKGLPKLQLPEFSGEVLEFQSFWDHFSSNIDSKNMPAVDKLLYLKSSLKGKAKNAIEGLEMTSKNYPIAVATLKERFGKENQIIDAHYAALYSIKVADSTASDCRRALNEIERHLRVLNSLGEDTSHNHLRFMIIEKFPEDVVYEMRLAVKTDTIDNLRKQLEIIISAREDASRVTDIQQKRISHYTVETLYSNQETQRNSNFRNGQQLNENGNRYNKQDNVIKGNNNRFLNSHNDRFCKRRIDERIGTNLLAKQQNQDRQSNSGNTFRQEPTTKRRKFSCQFCEGAHYNDQCDKVTTLEERKFTLKNRCFNCFQSGHQSIACNNKRKCEHCMAYGKHNRALCPKLFSKARVEVKT